MGVFSFITTDTQKSLPNRWNEERETFTVYLKYDKGNVWKEDQYDGYGIFGDRDIYCVIAEMNGAKGRDEGINIFFDQKKGTKYPNLLTDKSIKWENKILLDCEYQGHFY